MWRQVWPSCNHTNFQDWYNSGVFRNGFLVLEIFFYSKSGNPDFSLKNDSGFKAFESGQFLFYCFMTQSYFHKIVI